MRVAAAVVGPKSRVKSSPVALRVAGLAAVAMAVMPVASASAVTKRIDQLWLGSTAGTWTDATRWQASWYLEPGQPQPDYEGMYPDNTADTVFAVTIGSSTGAVTLDGRDVTIDFLRQYGNSTLAGSGNVNILGNFDWQGGTLTGTGSVTVNGDVTIDTLTQQVRTVGRVLNTYGTSTVTGYLYLSGPNGAWNNHGTFVLDKGANISASGSATFQNYGTFNKASTSTSYLYTNLDNAVDGVVSVGQGTLSILGGMTNAGTIDVAAGAKLSFNNGTGSVVESHVAGSRITGAGAVEFLAGTHNLASYDATGSVTFGSGTVTFNNTIHPSTLGDLAGTVNFNAAQSFPDVKLAGLAMGGTGDVEVTHQLTWLNGTMTGAGATTIATGASLSLSGTNSALNLTRTLTNNGTATHSGIVMVIGNGGTFANAGTFNATGTGGFYWGATYGAGKFNNTSVFRKTGTGTYKIEGVAFNNAGTVYVDQGTLDLITPFTNSGSIQLAAGTTLKLSGNTFAGQIGSSLTGPAAVQVTGGSHAFADGGAFAPAGPVTVTGGTLTLGGPFATASDFTLNGPGSTVTFNGTTNLNNLTFTTGTIGGTGAITVGGNVTWSSGSFAAGGRLVFTADATLSLGGTSGTYSSARPVETRGPVTWTNGQINVVGTTWDNYGGMAVGAVTTIGRTGSASGAFRNYGTITKTGTTTLSADALVSFQNYGTINLNGGGLILRDGATNAGTIKVATGTTLAIGPNAFTNQPGSMINGDGTVSFNGSTLINLPAGTFDPTGTVNFLYGSNVAINNAICPVTLGTIDGTVAFNADQTFPSVAVSGSGVLGGTGAVTVTDAFSWGGGATQINSAVTLGPRVTWDVAPASVGNRTLNGSLTINGIAHLTTGSYFLNGGSVLANNGTVEISAVAFAKGGTGTARIDNANLLTKLTNSTVTLAQGIALNNIGTVDVRSGTFGTTDAPAQQAGSALSGGTWVVRDGATLVLGGVSNIATNGATITLYGPMSKFDKINFLTTNNGSLSLLDGRSFTTAVGAGFTNAGTLVVQGGGTFIASAASSGTGNVTIGAGSTLAIKSGWNQTGGILAIDGTVTHSGGTSTISASTSQRWTDGSALNVTGGTLTLASDAGGYFPNFTLAATVAGTGATLQSSTSQRLKSLSVGAGGTVTLLNGTGATLFTHSLSLNATGKLDLNDNRLIVDDDLANGSPTLTALRQYLQAGSLFSTSAAGDEQHRKGIGYADASDLGVTTWGGLLIYPATAVARVTWIGDANLDGKVNADDYALIDRGLAKSVANAHWTDGDFNYDGLVNAADYLLIDRVFVPSNGGVASPALLADREMRFGATYVAELVTAVPEPGMLGTVLVGLAAAAGRRRRRR